MVLLRENYSKSQSQLQPPHLQHSVYQRKFWNTLQNQPLYKLESPVSSKTRPARFIMVLRTAGSVSTRASCAPSKNPACSRLKYNRPPKKITPCPYNGNFRLSYHSPSPTTDETSATYILRAPSWTESKHTFLPSRLHLGCRSQRQALSFGKGP